MSAYDVDDFELQVIERSRTTPVLVDFWADWCSPCRALGPVLEKLAREAAGRWELAKVDTEEHREVSGRFGIRSIPNVKLFVDGEPVSEFVGALPEPQVRQWLDQVLPRPSAAALQAAAALLAQDEAAAAAQARQMLEEIVASEPDNVEARVLWAWAGVFDDPQGAIEALEPVGIGTQYDDRVAALRTIARLLTLLPDGAALGDSSAKKLYLNAIEKLARRDYPSALARFIEVVALDRQLDDDGARGACLAIFEMLGADSSATREGRRALASALFV